MEIDSGLVGQANRQHIDTIRWRLQQLNSKTPEEQEVRLYKNDHTKLAIIELRSGAKNALSGRMISQLTEVLDELYNWPEGRGVLICGHAGTFCSGSDLMCVRQTASQEWGLDLAAVMQYNLRRLQLLPMISVALVEGYALGGGAELACAADMRLMTDSARIGFVHIKVGVCCGWGGGSRLVQLLGPSRALELLSSGRLVGATEALQLGLSNATIRQDFLGPEEEANENRHHCQTNTNTNANSNTTTTNGLLLVNNNNKSLRQQTTTTIANTQVSNINNNINRFNTMNNKTTLLETTTNFTRSSCDLNGNQNLISSLNGDSNNGSGGGGGLNGNGNGIASICSELLEETLERSEALQFLCQHTIGNLETIKALKSMINAARFEPLQEALAKEAHLFASTWGKQAHLKALAGNLKHNR